ncbi:MAG: HPF/RaiA family ribosome-associated protein [Candidatus Peregrinibacteria bacterium]
MQIKINTHEVILTSEQEALFRRKVEHLAQLASRLSDEASEIRLDLFRRKTKRPQDAYECHLTFFVPYDVLRAEACGETLENAADAVVGKMKTQIDRYKDKTHHLHERGKKS